MSNNHIFDFTFFNNLNDIFLLLSSDGTILSCNTSAENKLALSSDKIIGEKVYSFFCNSVRTDIEHFFSLEKKTKLEFNSARLKTENASIEAEVNITPSNGDYILQAKDLTADKRALYELETFYYVVEKSLFPLQITNLEGEMIYVNPAFVAASGYTKEELIGSNPNIFGSKKHSARFWNRMWNVIKTGKPWVGEVENRRKNGDSYYTQLLISPIVDHEGNLSGFFGVHRDLTEKRMLEKQLVHTQKMESIGTLAAGVAHEVGNPLASISALVQVVQRTTDDQFVKDKLELVKNQVIRISKIIRDLVDFSRPSNYELHLTDINKNIRDAVEMVKVGAKAKDITIETNLSPDLPLVPLIADQIHQIFVNILLNAVDAINDEANRKYINKIVISTSVVNDEVEILISDSGKGMPEDHLNKIFEPFFTTKKEGKGTGLGLWISYGIIKSFQGNIYVSSVEGSGSTFTITLPIQG
jgi:PAS domain S-box-containing protein